MALSLAMAGCGSSRDARLARPRPVFSPNGEIVSSGGPGAASCNEALGEWWDGIAAAHQGRLDKASFIEDAERQFAAMDLDHDGFITPYELSEYRAGLDEQAGPPVLPPGVTPPAVYVPPPSAPLPGDRRGRSQIADSGFGTRPRSTSLPPDLVDPVMSADRSLSFKVSHSDFIDQANDIFASFDKNRQGVITREALLASCPVK